MQLRPFAILEGLSSLIKRPFAPRIPGAFRLRLSIRRQMLRGEKTAVDENIEAQIAITHGVFGTVGAPASRELGAGVAESYQGGQTIVELLVFLRQFLTPLEGRLWAVVGCVVLLLQLLFSLTDVAALDLGCDLVGELLEFVPPLFAGMRVSFRRD